MLDEDIIICMPVEGLKDRPMDGSTEVDCADCKRKLWLSPEGREKKITVLCSDCAFKRLEGLPAGTVVPIIFMPDALEELRNQEERRNAGGFLYGG